MIQTTRPQRKTRTIAKRTPAAPGRSAPPPFDEVLAALRRDDSAEAVRLFVEAVEKRLAPRGAGFSKWLVETLGKDESVRLIEAFVTHPCFYCKHGVNLCEECKGRGWVKGPLICDRCVGLGVAACGFCGATGWVTINHAPEELRMAIVLGRMREAAKDIEAIQQKAAAEATPRKEGRKALARQLLRCNRVMGFLENAVVGTRSLSRKNSKTAPMAAKVIDKCMRIAPRIEKKMRVLLAELGRASEEDASRRPAGSSKELARIRAKFYSLLAKKAFRGTGLAHPFLRGAAREG